MTSASAFSLPSFLPNSRVETPDKQWMDIRSRRACTRDNFTGFLALLMLFGSGRAAQAPASPPSPELWYWHHSYLVNDENVESSKALIKKAAAAGYTGVVFWDSSFNFMGNPSWPPITRTACVR